MKRIVETIEPEWLTIEEACRYLKISRNTLMKHISNGEIYATKRLGRWRVRKQSIDTFMNEEDMAVDLLSRAGIKCGT